MTSTKSRPLALKHHAQLAGHLAKAMNLVESGQPIGDGCQHEDQWQHFCHQADVGDPVRRREQAETGPVGEEPGRRRDHEVASKEDQPEFVSVSPIHDCSHP